MGCPANNVLKDAAASPRAARFSDFEKCLLNDFQRDFPLTRSPFLAIANRLRIGEQEVLDTLRAFQEEGLVSRVGPVFSPNRVGKSTLAAMAVPEARLDEVAELVNSYDEVNHNYEREHRFNLWFVATAPDQTHLDAVLQDMELRTGIAVMSLPMLDSYHIDLGFTINWERRHGDSGHGKRISNTDSVISKGHHSIGKGAQDSDQIEFDRRLVAAIQKGLPLVHQPYAAIGAELGVEESEVIARLQAWLDEGTLNRIGVVVRHRKLGYQANAMVVWDVPDEHVAQLGRCFSEFDFVTLCYRRPRRLPQWRYNLFCMIHGQDREAVLERVNTLVSQCGEAPIPFQVLFSRRCFKQRGARYQKSRASSERVSELCAIEEKDVIHPA